MKKLRISLFILMLIAFSCGQKKSNPDYYFPVTKFNAIKIYTYVNQSDTTEKSYWEMQTSITGKDTFLQTSIFDTAHRIGETIVEKVSGGNAYLTGYALFNYDAEGKQLRSECTIIENNMFKINQKKGEKIQWKVRFQDPSSQTCEMSKTRTFIRTGENRKVFNDEFELLITEKAFTGKYSMISVYARDTGIVAFTMNLPGGIFKDFKLISQSDRH
jgi:hypothetical protein